LHPWRLVDVDNPHFDRAEVVPLGAVELFGFDGARTVANPVLLRRVVARRCAG
jgi:hypothetical protein